MLLEVVCILQIETKYQENIVNHSFFSISLDDDGVDVADVEVVVIVVFTEHMSMTENGMHTGEEQHALTTHTDFNDGQPEPLVLHISNSEHAGAGAHTLEPVEVLNE